MNIALIGCNGFVGSRLSNSLSRIENCTLTRVHRQNYYQEMANTYDIVINTATPSRRFWAKQYPEKDFAATVSLTSDIINNWHFDKLIQISSVSARSQLDTVYGRHKASAEKLVDLSKFLIVRLGPMYGDGLTKGVLLDLVSNKKVFASRFSQYCFTPVNWVSDWVASNLFRTGLLEIGAKNFVTLEDVASAINSNSEFTDYLDHQVIMDPPVSAPEASDVLSYVVELKSKIRFP